ncbi:MAG: AAA family ATPase [Myxococcales bacterium]|nr:AAA family ATPase [Myxococcales bacterium]
MTDAPSFADPVAPSSIQRVASLVDRALGDDSARKSLLFAHLCVERPSGPKDYFVGASSDVDAATPVVHWRTAPLARLLYGFSEGDFFELDTGARQVEGRLVEKHLLHFDAERSVVAIERNGVRYTRGGPIDARSTTVALRSVAERSRPRNPVDVTLDDAQRSAVERAARAPLLVLGQAGAGKTTVALHRVAHLVRLARERKAPVPRVLVVAPTEGLRRLLRGALERLSVDRAEVVQCDRWAFVQARRAFERISARPLNDDAPAGVLRVKRCRALREVIARYARARNKGTVRRDDLHELFGDRALLAALADGPEAPATKADLATLTVHTRAQFRERTEDEFAGVVDTTRLETVDGLSIDQGTSMDLAGRLDAEDPPVLFEIARAAGRPARVSQYDCIVVDEAQELAPLELALIGDALAPGGSLIVAGDASQQVDSTASFESWAQTMADLGARSYATVDLETSYRCPPSVIAFARGVLEVGVSALDRDELSRTERVSRWVDTSEAHLLARVGECLRALRREDRAATVALVARDEASVARWSEVLGPDLGVHYARGGDFSRANTAHACTVREIKGLEFDYVFALDATRSAYGDGAHGRHALYVASTRATHALVLGAVE